MITNTPTPAPDLDARVAALMSKIVNHRYVPIERVDEERAEIEQTLRAELQKPALHEPVGIVVSYREWELTAQINLVPTMNGKSPVGIGTPLFLQGRAKPAQEAPCQHKVFSHFGDQKARRCVNCGIQEPAQEEITDAEIYKIILKMEQSPSFSYDTRDRDLVRAAIRASKGEKT